MWFFEKFDLREHLTNHLDEHNLITPRQHGFVKNKSCQTNLLETNGRLDKSIGQWIQP